MRVSTATRERNRAEAERPREADGAQNGEGSSTVALDLLNGFELRAAGARVELPLSAQRLVAFLALHRRPVQRVFVAGALWTDSPEDRSLANLRSALWRLRRAKCPVILARGSLLALSEETTVDVNELNSLARDVLQGSADGNGEEVEGLMHGDLLPDWYEDWVNMERERLRHLRLHALESLCEQLTAAGDYWSAIDVAMVAVRANPLRESAHRALIGAHLAEGNAVEAVRHYREFCAVLRRELGLAPSPHLRRLLSDLPR
jgi:DNA-binding SARP family transcriptional activator